MSEGDSKKTGDYHLHTTHEEKKAPTSLASRGDRDPTTDDDRPRDKVTIWTELYEDEDDSDDATIYMSQEARERYESDVTLTNYDRMVIQKLACRRYYIPGNTFWEDFYCWNANNHPFLALCLADSRHPLGQQERLINVLATLSFGLAATSCVFLWFYNEDKDIHRVVGTFWGFNITIGFLVLAFTGPVHVLFDLSMFYIQACPLCREGGLCSMSSSWFLGFWLWMGKHIALVVMVAALLLAVTVALIRASIVDDGVHDEVTLDYEDYYFLYIYIIQMLFSNVVFFPICTLFFFSGAAGLWGSIPGLGGWHDEKRMYEGRVRRRKFKSTPIEV